MLSTFLCKGVPNSGLAVISTYTNLCTISSADVYLYRVQLVLLTGKGYSFSRFTRLGAFIRSLPK